ncbi:MAG: hypothetical protein LBU32_01235 [Clostridiales bacterium]|jgi:D-3-phosphoglycerate dehydrogenase|nr:hypothetical protein [Clostridiales bacterium]
MKISMLEPLAVLVERLREQSRPFIDEGRIAELAEAPISEAGKLERAKGADVLIIANSPLSKEVVEARKNLKMISVAFTGVDHIPAEDITRWGILV